MTRKLGLVLGIMSLFVAARDEELEEFIEKDIKIFFASFPTSNLGLDERNGILVSHSKYVNPSKYKFITRARLVKSGSKYIIIFGENNICKDGNSGVKCKEERPWNIDRKPFGYTISIEDKCITKGPDADIEMKSCVNTDDQIFQFKLADLGGCGSLESLLNDKNGEKFVTTNVNILPPGGHLHSDIGITTKEPGEKNILVKKKTISRKGVHRGIPIVHSEHVEEPVGAEIAETPYKVKIGAQKQNSVVVRQVHEDSVSGQDSGEESVPVNKGLQTSLVYPRKRKVMKESHYAVLGEHNHLNHKRRRETYNRSPIVPIERTTFIRPLVQ